ncbi:hypothetical protein N7530_004025 [Penicillium desertorum]|uniref:Uncharacterized protein n=1 Tax=Penicillium desertorum TaxID=1303715 RepID=A0A9W9WYC9_9EURO|nr:hypothetical protein N7530_004025 [Penicillium desertorum]
MSPANITLWARGTASDLESVPDTFSSWDKCMAKSYCKWPVIVGIIVGRRRNKTPKHFDDFHQPPPAPNPVYQPPPAPPSYRGAQQSAPSFRGAQQTAHFDAPKSPAHVNEDALPEMPTWAGAVDKHVEDPNHRGDVEMEPLNPPRPKTDRHTRCRLLRLFTQPNHGRGYSRIQRIWAYRSACPPVSRPGSRLESRPRSLWPTLAGHTFPRGEPLILMEEDPRAQRRLVLPRIHTDDVPPAQQRWLPLKIPPAAGYGAAAHDPYGPRSPGVTSPVGAPVHNPYDQQQYQDSYDDHSYGAGNGYHAVAAPSPVAAYKPHTNYSPVPMAFSPSSEIDHSAAAAPTPGFQRQPSFGSSQYPPTYTSQPPYRGFSPAPSSPPPAFSAASPSEYATYNPHANTIPIPEPDNTRPPSLLQSGKKPTVNASSNF